MVSTHLKNISQIGSFLQVGVKIKNIWNHHPICPSQPPPTIGECRDFFSSDIVIASYAFSKKWTSRANEWVSGFPAETSHPRGFCPVVKKRCLFVAPQEKRESQNNGVHLIWLTTKKHQKCTHKKKKKRVIPQRLAKNSPLLLGILPIIGCQILGIAFMAPNRPQVHRRSKSDKSLLITVTGAGSPW